MVQAKASFPSLIFEFPQCDIYTDKFGNRWNRQNPAVSAIFSGFIGLANFPTLVDLSDLRRNIGPKREKRGWPDSPSPIISMLRPT